jgi:seryl-tRNA(Sec) selenium transferase
MPEHELETVVVQWRPNDVSASAAAAGLRDAEVPIIVRVRDDAVCFDLRTLRADDFDAVVDGVFGVSLGDEEDEETKGISLPVVE